MVTHVATLLNGARHAYFVGRHDERQLFSSLLERVCLPFCGLYVYGPGGVGKTALLGEFARLCQGQGIPFAYLDGRDLEATPESLLGAVGAALGQPAGESPWPMLRSTADRCVLFIDAYDVLAPLDPWLRQTFLPALSRHVLVVLAGREAPSVAWRGDSGWQMLIHPLALRNLAPDDSRDYLTRRGVPADQHAAIVVFTYGHPLALSLVADACAQNPAWRFQPEAAPDLISALLERLVEKAPDATHRNALDALALARVTTEGLLTALLDIPDAHTLFEWLRGLSFVQSGAEGLQPHDLVREALSTELRWRNPDWHAELHRRARAYYTQHLRISAGQTQQQDVFDYIFLHRDHAVVRPFFDWRQGGGLFSDAARPADRPALLAMVTRHEGHASARLAAGWLDHPAAQTIVIRDNTPQPAGFLTMLALQAVTPADVEADPAVRAALGFLAGRLRLDAGERATLFRFWMAREAYQAVSTIQSLVFVTAIQHYLTTPGLAYTLFPCADPEFWAAVFTYADLERLPAAEFELDGRHYGVFGHDWRAVPPVDWLNLLAERELQANAPFGTPPAASEELLVLSRPDFAAAVRQALHDLGRPALLRGNPLLRSRLVTHRSGLRCDEPERIAGLQALLRETIGALQATPRDLKLHRALFHTFVQPAPTQERAAELLDVPFSTFRRHLTTGVERVTDTLWEMELG